MNSHPTTPQGSSCLPWHLALFTWNFKRSFVLALALLAAGCATPKSYYVLTAEGSAPAGGGTAIGVGPVSLAGYLDRTNLVFQEGGNRMSVAESHRWAGDLEENIARVTATNVGRRLGTGNIRTYPWGSDGELRYQVTLDIRQLHGTADGPSQKN